MLRRLASFGVVSLGALSLALSPSTSLAADTPAPATVPTTQKVVATPPAAPNSVEKARQGVVVLERQGKALALGVVLEGDGRILSALSPLTNGNFLSARYSDGAVVPLKLVHSDRGWDLALLSPVSGPKQPLHKS